MTKTIYLLVGGEATRLKPLSEGTPKALLTIKGVTIVDLIIENLERAGFAEFKLICSIKHKEQWEDYRIKTHRDIHLLFEAEKLDTAGYIVKNIEDFEDEFFCMNGDLLLEMNFEIFMDKVEVASKLLLDQEGWSPPCSQGDLQPSLFRVFVHLGLMWVARAAGAREF